MTAVIEPVAAASYLDEVLAAVHPPPYRLDPGRAPVAYEYRLVPHRHRPRLVVPADRRLAAAALRQLTRSPAARLGAAGLRLPGTSPLLGPRLRVYGPAGADHLGSYVARMLDLRPASAGEAGSAGPGGGAAPLGMGMRLGGPFRANRKPVVVLLDGAGHTVGYAKLGVTPLARALVRNERAALRTLAHVALPGLELPRLLHGGVWAGHELVVQSALPTTAPAVSDAARRIRAMCALARVCGSRRARLTDAPYWAALATRAERTGDPRLAAAVGLVRRAAGGSYLEYGAWHGDWTPWNSHPTGDAVLLWDWERFATGVPVGYDALHHRLAELLAARAPEPLSTLVTEATALLAPFGPEPFGLSPAQSRTTAVLYLLEVATRYVTDQQGTAAAATVVAGLLPIVTSLFASESHLGGDE